MSGRQLASVFVRFERDRAAFASAVADAARNESNATSLIGLDAPALLIPLLNDPSEAVAHTAAFALGRLAGHSRAMAAELVQAGVVGTLITRMQNMGATAAQDDTESRTGDSPSQKSTIEHLGSKRAAMSMLASLSRHSPKLAAAVADQGGLDAAVACLSEPDGETRESAAWALAHVVAMSEELATRVCTAGALSQLVACLGPNTSTAAGAGAGVDAAVKRVAASALADIAAHSSALAASVVAVGAVHAICRLLRQPLTNDARLRRQLLCTLMHVAKADAGLARAVVDAGLVPVVARCLKFADDTVRRHAATCLRNIVRHGEATAAAVAEGEVLNQLAGYAASQPSIQALPALTALGFIAEQSPDLAARVAAAPGALAALDAALQCSDEHGQTAAAWALGRVGGHSAALAAAVSACLPQLCNLATTAPADGDLQVKCMRASGAIIGQSTDVAQLAGLVMQPGLASPLLELLLGRCAAVMAKHPASRAAFASLGALAHLEARQAKLAGSSCAEAQHIQACLRLFPEELLRHYSPTYAAKLLASLGTDPPPADAIPAIHTDAPAEVTVGEADSPAAAHTEAGAAEAENDAAHQLAPVLAADTGAELAAEQADRAGQAEQTAPAAADKSTATDGVLLAAVDEALPEAVAPVQDCEADQAAVTEEAAGGPVHKDVQVAEEPAAVATVVESAVAAAGAEAPAPEQLEADPEGTSVPAADRAKQVDVGMAGAPASDEGKQAAVEETGGPAAEDGEQAAMEEAEVAGAAAAGQQAITGDTDAPSDEQGVQATAKPSNGPAARLDEQAPVQDTDVAAAVLDEQAAVVETDGRAREAIQQAAVAVMATDGPAPEVIEHAPVEQVDELATAGPQENKTDGTADETQLEAAASDPAAAPLDKPGATQAPAERREAAG